MDPITFEVKPPKTPFHLPQLPHFTDKSTKIITAAAAIVISISMVSFVVFGVMTNTGKFKSEHGLLPAPTTAKPSGLQLSQAALPGGSTAVGTGGTTGNNSPVVTMTATPASVVAGGTTHLKWSVTNNPKSCVASDDWSGDQPASGELTTPPLTKVQTYMYTLTCTTATGTGFSTVAVGSTAQGGTGAVGRPVVTIATNPGAIYTGDKSTLIWNASNSPTSCTASGDWSGSKSSAGSENTANLTTVKSYSYTLTCANAAGSGFATASLNVTAPPANLPIITMSASTIGSLHPGDSTTLTWSVDNNPTSCTASGDWAGAKAASGSQTVGPLTTIKTYAFKLSCSNSAGSIDNNVTVQVIPGPPSVALTASPASILLGSTSTLTWSSTNSPASCTASGDWTGTKAASGTASTGTLTTVKTYSYSLSCTNVSGTATANATVTVTNPPPPVVSLSVNPISTTTGNSATLTWSATNSPTSCTASGDWTGTKAASGTQSTGALTTVKTYSYTLACANAGGSNSSTVSVGVSQSGGTVVIPAVTISVAPTTLGTGSSATISWTVANSPTACTASGSWSGTQAASGSTSTGAITTAGTKTYTLTCSNSAGSGASSASLTAIATPAVSISLSPASISAGGTSTLTWSATNSPTSCTAGGSWSGTKAASGSQSVTQSTAGSYIYSLSCTNGGGTNSNSATLTVNPVVATYCSGLTPCYGPNDLKLHATVGNCWGYNLTWVINITSYAPSHKGGASAGSLESPAATCGLNLAPILAGSAAIPGYKDDNGSTTHGHASSTTNNSSSSALKSYVTGYYDATKP